MDLVLWLVSLFLLWWGFIIVAAQALKMADGHPRLAALAGLLALVMAVLIVVWVVNESMRIQIAEFIVGAVVATFVVAVIVRLWDRRAPARSVTSAGPARSSAGFESAAMPVPPISMSGSAAQALGMGLRCSICGTELLRPDEVVTQQLLLVQGGAADSARAVENAQGYRCQACSKDYCKQCLERSAPPKPGGGRLCPACGGSFGYIPG